METIDLAIIIPTLNEQQYIGILLDSLAQQTVIPREIIIVDAHSTDATKEEVEKKKHLFPQLSFYQIPKDTVAKQRNYGVSKSSTDHLLFLDADMFCETKTTLEVFYTRILSKSPDAAATYVKPSSEALKDRFLYGVANIIQAGMQRIKPLGTTMNLYVHRHMFIQLHGFDQTLGVGEDFEFLARLGKANGVFMVLWEPKFYTSVRRLDYEGRLTYMAKLLHAMLHIRIKGYKANPITYEFGQFGGKTVNREVYKNKGTMG